MTFQHPEWLGAALASLVAFSGVLLLSRARHERRRARLLGGPRRSIFQPSDALLLGAAGFIAVALLGPLAGTERVRVPASGIDVVVLLDVSLSMEASDTPPSRLARARRAAAQTLRELDADDRAALAVFAGQAAPLTPLTPDKAALLDLLRYVDTRLTSDRSSHMEAGLKAALATFDADSARPRRLLIVSDGEHGGEVPAALLAEFRRAGVRVVAAAVGSDAGATVPTRGGRLLRHPNGKPVVSRRDPASLERIAGETGGAFFLGDAFGSFAAGSLSRALAAGATPVGEGFVEQEVPVPRTRLPAAVALILLVAEMLRRDPPRASRVWPTDAPRKAGWLARRGGLRAATASLLAVLLLGANAGDDELLDLEARLRTRPDDTHLLIELGVVRAREGLMREAERAFLAASIRSSDPELAALAYYDLGVALLSRGHYEGARDAFLDALAFDPEHEAARFNLAWSLRALDAIPPPQGGGEPGEPDESDPGEAGDDPQSDDEQPREEAEERPQPSPDSRGRERQQAPALDAEEAQRWLDAARDDPSRALRGALGEGGTQGSGPQW